jgi:hypothetical protein
MVPAGSRKGRLLMTDQCNPVSPELRRCLRTSQALEDAIAFRLARGAVPCLDCEDAEDGKCDDHACDLVLIEAYRQMSLNVEDKLAGVPVSSGPPQIPSPFAAVAQS